MRISPLTTPAPTAPAPTPPAERWPIDAAWQTVGRLEDARLNEVSGVAVSQARAGVLWVHNDSGDGPRVFAIDAAGKLLQEVRVDGAFAYDWEDISMGPGRGGMGSALYIADTGDNFLIRPKSTIYRVAEPAPGATNARAERIEFTFPDGHSRDVEAVTVDPRTGDVFVISKQRRDGEAEVFRLARTQVDAGGGTLELTGRLPQVGKLVTGADVSGDGSKIAITTYQHTYEWLRGPGESVADALRRAPQRAMGGADAETIAYDRDGRTLVAIPEGVNAPIYRRDALEQRSIPARATTMQV